MYRWSKEIDMKWSLPYSKIMIATLTWIIIMLRVRLLGIVTMKGQGCIWFLWEDTWLFNQNVIIVCIVSYRHILSNNTCCIYPSGFKYYDKVLYICVSICMKYISLEILADWEIEKSEWQANVGYQTERIFGLIDS